MKKVDLLNYFPLVKSDTLNDSINGNLLKDFKEKLRREKRSVRQQEREDNQGSIIDANGLQLVHEIASH